MNIIVWKKTKSDSSPKLMVDDEDLFGHYTFNEALGQIKLLNSLNYKGHSDWRLPNKDELNEMYKIKDVIGGFASTSYWSSSESSSFTAWLQYFYNGFQNGNDKDDSTRVRAVRNI